MLTLVHAIAFDLIGLGGAEKKGAGMGGEELNSKLKKSTGSGEREGRRLRELREIGKYFAIEKYKGREPEVKATGNGKFITSLPSPRFGFVLRVHVTFPLQSS